MRGQESFLEQVCRRVSDKVLIDTCLQRSEKIGIFKNGDKPAKEDGFSVRNQFCHFRAESFDSDYYVHWDSLVGGAAVRWDGNLCDRIYYTVVNRLRLLHAKGGTSFDGDPKVRFWCFSEAHVPEKSVELEGGLTFRCHPNYHGEDRWYDWIVICRKELGDNSYILGKLISVIHLQVGTTSKENESFILIHPCELRSF